MELIFASHNQHKLQEIQVMMPKGIVVKSLSDIGYHYEIEETGDTFNENAAIKARAVFEATGLPCFADDSGLAVEALNGAPGVKSARYAGEPANNAANIQKLLSNLENESNKTAYFITVICLKTAEAEYFFEGRVNGHIIPTPTGEGGFGYDPVFVPDGDTRTFAQMTAEEKNSISHRKRALQKMTEFLSNRMAG